MKLFSRSFRAGQANRVGCRGFTLVEILVGMAIMLILMVAVLGMTDRLREVLRMSRSKVEIFRDGRAAFLAITQRLKQATLNTYWDYDDANTPTRYVRNSYLHFTSGPADEVFGAQSSKRAGHAVFFTVPGGYTEDRADLGALSYLINGCGYYVEYSQDPAPPAFLGADAVRKWRWRLKQFQEPAETSLVQKTGWTTATAGDWFRSYFTRHQADPEANALPVCDIADNVILLLLLPVLPQNEDRGDALAPEFSYNSREAVSFTTQPPPPFADYTSSTLHQLPPLLRVVMVVIDEESATRLNPTNSPTPQNLIPAALFQNAIELDDDLVKLEEVLQRLPEKVAYRIFDSTIALPGAKWSRN